MARKQQFFSLRDIFTIFFKHKYKIIIPFLAISVSTLFWAFVAPAQYTTRALVMIKPETEYTFVNEPLPAFGSPTMSQESMMNTEVQILTSKDLLGDVAASVGIYDMYPELKEVYLNDNALREAAILLFRQDLSVNTVTNSNVIEIRFQHKNPYTAEKATNVLIKLFKDKHAQFFGISKSTFFEDQLTSYGDRLKEAETKLAAYKKIHNIIHIKDQFWHIIGKHTEMSATLKLEESKLRELQEKVDFLKKHKKKNVSDPYGGEMRTMLAELEQREAASLTTYKENGSLAEMEAEVGAQQIKIKNMKRQVAQLEGELHVLSAANKEYGILERERDMLQKNYESYQRKYENMKIADGLNKGKAPNIQIVEQASLPVLPVRTNQKKILGIGILVALCAGLALAYFAERISQTITTPQGVTKHLRLTVLTAVSLKK